MPALTSLSKDDICDRLIGIIRSQDKLIESLREACIEAENIAVMEMFPGTLEKLRAAITATSGHAAASEDH